MVTKAQDNFYQSVNEEWISQATIREDAPTAGGFTDLHFEIEDTLQKAADDFLKNGDAPAHLKNFLDLYKLASDFTKREKDGVSAFKEKMALIENLNSWQDFSDKAYELYTNPLSSGLPFGIEQDWLDTSKYVLAFGSLSTILPDTTYYQEDNEQKEQLLSVWQESKIKLLKAAGYSNAEEIVEDALKFDANLAKYILSNEEQSEYFKLYHPVNFDDFAKDFTTFDLREIAQNLLKTKPDKVVYFDDRFYENLNNVYQKDNFKEFKNYLVTLSTGLLAYTTEELRLEAGVYNRTITGTPKATEKKLAAYRLANDEFGFLIGEYFRHIRFSAEAKTNVENMIKKMINIYRERLTNNEWLQKQTIQEAIKKLDAIAYHIGYPDEIPARFLERKVDINKTLLENIWELDGQEIKFQLNKYGNKVDRNEWDMTPATVNAYYDPMNNSINFPAAILQLPFYSFDRPSSFNYGGIGAVIAHEISHAFDSNGAHFDEIGTLKDWWTKEDFDNFELKNKKIVELWDGLDIPGTKAKVNGKLTLSENIADLGGLSAALQAAKTENDYNPEELFISWATVWRQKARQEYKELLANMDTHAPGELRGNEAVKNFNEFFEAFNIQEGDLMWRSVEDRAQLW
ncbi:MAG: M13 family peptidase [Lactobacillaceae bacterium]|jgi:putative endopeptidase|nr:M13 family peptidase [Lactobacillaceae bacterium]